jgi:hypothetical protein
MEGSFLKYSDVHESREDGYLGRKVWNLKVEAESLIALAATRSVLIGWGSQNGGYSWVDSFMDNLNVLLMICEGNKNWW